MPQKTQCPHCHTSFRVTLQQLAKADGMVRCGDCLGAFQANDFFIDEMVTESTLTDADLPVKAAQQTSCSTPEDAFSTFEPPADDGLLFSQVANNTDESTNPESGNPTIRLDGALINGGNEDHDEVNESVETIALRPAAAKTHPWRAACLSIMLILGLLFQYASYEKPTLAQHQLLRPAYQLACDILPCQLAPLFDMQKIYYSNLIIRSLPDSPDVLLVDLWLHNRADFNQQFPELTLVFRNSQGEPVASGLFDSDGYLATDLKVMKTMPPSSQIHLSFRIPDPGDNALNYKLKLLAPDHA